MAPFWLVPLLSLLLATTGGHAMLKVDLDHALCFDLCELSDQVGTMDATLYNGASCTLGEGIVFDGVNDYVRTAPGGVDSGVSRFHRGRIFLSLCRPLRNEN